LGIEDPGIEDHRNQSRESKEVSKKIILDVRGLEELWIPIDGWEDMQALIGVTNVLRVGGVMEGVTFFQDVVCLLGGDIRTAVCHLPNHTKHFIN
jgi:hypothetical protein